MLRAMLDIWTAAPNSESSSHSFNLAMLRAAASTCFFGFFRSGEITVPSRSTFDPLIHLAWGDVAVDGSLPPSSVRIHLKRSKCDQLGRGVDIFLGRSGSPTCPVEEIIRYVSPRGPAPGSFFRLADRSPLTKAAFVGHVRSALTTMGLGAHLYARHSVRKSAATTAAEAGLEDSIIRLLGRWNSDAFHRYIRTPRETLAGFTSRMTSHSPALALPGTARS